MIVLAFSSKVCALRLALASAAALSVASFESSCPDARIGRARHSATTANAIAFRSKFVIETSREGLSTVLRTRRDDPAARQRDRPDQAHRRFIARATELDLEALAHVGREIVLADVADAEPGRRRALGLPGLHRAAGILHVDREVDVRITP